MDHAPCRATVAISLFLLVGAAAAQVEVSLPATLPPGASSEFRPRLNNIGEMRFSTALLDRRARRCVPRVRKAKENREVQSLFGCEELESEPGSSVF